MQFTYDAYRALVALLQQHGYEIADYHNWQAKKRCVIWHHDIDTSLEDALRFAEYEHKNNIKSTYLVLVSGDLYSVFSKKSRGIIQRMQELGHEIGLHFDETVYPEIAGDISRMQEKILQESQLLQTVTGNPVTVVSMHRPSKTILEADLQIPGIINSYSNLFFKQFKYLSDSRCNWREPVEEIVESEEHNRLQILMHPFWYHDENKTAGETLKTYIDTGNQGRYIALSENIRDIGSLLIENG